MKKFKIKKFIITFLSLVLLSNSILSINVEAKITGHDSYVIVPRLGHDATYSFTIYDDQNSFGEGYEQKTKKNFAPKLLSEEYGDLNSNLLGIEPGDNFKSLLFMSFPGHQSKTFGAYDGEDQKRAYYVAEKLTNSLNNIIRTIDSVDGYTDITSKNIQDAIAIMGKGIKNPANSQSSGFQSVYVDGIGYLYYGFKEGGTKGLHFNEVDGVNTWNKDIELYVYFSTTKTTAPTEDTFRDYSKFTWAVLKGYLSPEGIADVNGKAYVSGLSTTEVNSYNATSNESGDTPWITIFDIATIANYHYYIENMDSSVIDEADQGFIVTLITGIAATFTLSIKSILGLKDVRELVYSSDNNLSGGLMNNNWWSIMLKYYTIFLIIALFMIGLAIAKMLNDLNLSTINSNVRISLMESLVKIVIVGFLLVLSIPILRLLSDINAAIVGVFATQAPNDDGDMFYGAGRGLAGVVLSLAYLGILLMLNATYLMRGIMIALFGASSPLFIVSMMFTRGKGLLDNWFKEIFANIFLQSVHAFTFAFLFSVINTTAGTFPKLVIAYSLIPISEMFRGFIFGNAGGFTSSQGAKVGSYVQQRASNLAQMGSKLAGETASNLKTNRNPSLKGAMEENVGTGGSGGARNASASGNSLSSTFKEDANQKFKEGNITGMKGASISNLKGRALSAAGSAFGGTMSAMNAMTSMQMGNAGEAARGMSDATAVGTELASKSGGAAIHGASMLMDNNAKKNVEKYNTALPVMSGYDKHSVSSLTGASFGKQAKAVLNGEGQSVKYARALNRLGLNSNNSNANNSPKTGSYVNSRNERIDTYRASSFNGGLSIEHADEDLSKAVSILQKSGNEGSDSQGKFRYFETADGNQVTLRDGMVTGLEHYARRSSNKSYMNVNSSQVLKDMKNASLRKEQFEMTGLHDKK